ncbi:MAG: type II toxin-antitoxin system PemK/MazF family toxin [Jiangellaceae bacterium]
MTPRRGQIWSGDLGSPIGHEQAKSRPLLVVSGDRFSGTELVTVLPITTAHRPYPTRVELDGPLDEVCYVQVEQIRTISTRRLINYLADIDPVDMAKVEDVLALFLELQTS